MYPWTNLTYNTQPHSKTKLNPNPTRLEKLLPADLCYLHAFVVLFVIVIDY
jgi:hypothetical protein